MTERAYMFHVAIVSDEDQLIGRMTEILEDSVLTAEEKFRVHVCKSVYEIIEPCQCGYDVLFLDMEAQGSDPMEAARLIRGSDEQSVLVFLSDRREYAIKGYEAGADDFLLKSFDEKVFRQLWQRILPKLNRRKEDFLFLKQKGGAVRIALKDIYYIECMGHRLVFHTKKGIFERSGTMRETEDRLSAADFVRCNRCYLVNLGNVDGVLNDYVLIEEDELKISRPCKIPFMSALASYYRY